jgi:glutamate formiminotransferase
VRSLGIPIGDQAQVSCNLIDPESVGPAQVYDAIARAVSEHGGRVVRAELVGLVPARVLDAIPGQRHDELDLSPDRTIEARLESTGRIGLPLKKR